MKLGKYRHYKSGNIYQVLGIGKHSETLEELVIYECLYENPESKLWVRPLKMFLEKVTLHGKKSTSFYVYLIINVFIVVIIFYKFYLGFEVI